MATHSGAEQRSSGPHFKRTHSHTRTHTRHTPKHTHTKRSTLDPAFARSLGLDAGTMQALLELPGTKGNLKALRSRATALGDWKVHARAWLLFEIGFGLHAIMGVCLWWVGSASVSSRTGDQAV